MPINSTPFYHETTRKLITVFGTLFNNIKVVRDNAKEITVPIQYGSKEKWYTRLKQDPNLAKSEAITLPRLGFISPGLTYDSIRKLSSITKLTGPNSESTTAVKTVFQPVPYSVDIELFLWSKTMTDGMQILEQIIPFFRPSFTVTMVELSDPEITRDVLITLNSIVHTDNAEGLLNDTRMLEWTFGFNIEANYYGPVSDSDIMVLISCFSGNTPTLETIIYK